MVLKRCIEARLRQLTRETDIDCSDDLAERYQTLREEDGSDCDRMIFARALFFAGELDPCRRFIEHENNIKIIERLTGVNLK